MWGDKFQVIVTTHLNTNHTHNHFVVNSLSIKDGSKYNYSNSEMARLRQVNDFICEEHNLSVLGEKISKRKYFDFSRYNNKDNENFLDSKDRYNNEKSKIIRKFFKLIKQRAKLSEKLKKYEEVFGKYESLSEKNKMKIFDEIFVIILKYLEIQEQENKEEICKKEGHVFGKWNHNKWTDYVDTVIDHQHISNYPVKHENWERTCGRCSLVEKVDYEPEELIDERKEKNKIREIKRLEKKLQKLKPNE